MDIYNKLCIDYKKHCQKIGIFCLQINLYYGIINICEAIIMTKFTAVTDMHYSDRLNNGDRLNSLSAKKLKDALESENKDNGFIVNLGDTADGYPEYKPQLELLGEIADIFKASGRKFYSVIGNHDTSSDKHDYYKILGMPNRYYTFDAGDYLGVVLDAAMDDPEKPYPDHEMTWYTPYLDEEQIQWFQKTVNESEKRILVFTHFPFIIPDPDCELINNPFRNHYILNRDKIMDVLCCNDKIRAVFSGHYHDGSVMLIDGKPFVIFRSMAEGGECTFADVEIDDETLKITGHGRQESFTLTAEK